VTTHQPGNHTLQPSSPAKAGDPVLRDVSDRGVLDPRVRGDDTPPSFRDAPLGAGPESITTNADVARCRGRCAVDNRHRWLWIPGSRSARPGMTRVLCPTGKSVKPCPAQVAKIYRFTSHPNQFYRSAVSRSHRGAYHDRHERWRGMRWTLRGRTTNDTDADGKAVWSWRPDAGVKFAGQPASDGGKQARSPGRARNKP
jgi:hypothetical protein